MTQSPKLLCLICVVGFAARVEAQTPMPEGGLEETVVCKDFVDHRSISRSGEKPCLTKLNWAVTRDNKILRLTLRDGSKKSFKNAADNCRQSSVETSCPSFTLNGYYAQNHSLVIERWFASGPTDFLLGAYMIERETGRVPDLPSEPYYSPDGSKFVSISVCFDYCANRIDLWSVQNGSAKLDWRYRVKQGESSYYYKFIGWTGNEEVKIQIFPEGPAEGDAGRSTLEDQGIGAKILRVGTTWALQKDAPPKP